MFGFRAADSEYLDAGGGIKMRSGFHLPLHAITFPLNDDCLGMMQ